MDRNPFKNTPYRLARTVNGVIKLATTSMAEEAIAAIEKLPEEAMVTFEFNSSYKNSKMSKIMHPLSRRGSRREFLSRFLTHL